MTDLYTTTAGLSLRTDDALMFPEYGPDRWEQNIHELLAEGYSAETVEWIVRSKIARWANDANLSMVEYIQRHVGDVRLQAWMNNPLTRG